MSCLRCQDLERALEVRQSEYSAALASPYFRVSRKFAAYFNVELERAKNELEEHRLVCVSAIKQPAALSAVARPRFAQEELRGVWTETAA
jgi:hypothetical protein